MFRVWRSGVLGSEGRGIHAELNRGSQSQIPAKIGKRVLNGSYRCPWRDRKGRVIEKTLRLQKEHVARLQPEV